jgi:hypothetical protein
MHPSIEGPFDLVISVKTPRLYSSTTGPREGCLPDSTQFDFVTGSSEPFTGHSAAVVANATTGNETATNTPTRKWTKWITAHESVVKVRYIRTTDEKLLHSSDNWGISYVFVPRTRNAVPDMATLARCVLWAVVCTLQME